MKARVIADLVRIDGAPGRFDHARMHRWRAFALAVLALLSLHAFAQETDSAKFFSGAQQQIADIRKELGDVVDEAKLNDFNEVATSIGASADALIADRSPRLDAIDARVAELGPAPAKGQPAEAADVAAQRAALAQQRATLDGEIKRARLLSVDSRQLTDEIAEARRADFQARLSQRTDSPLMPAFWQDVGGHLAGDAAHLDALRSGVVSALGDSFAPDNRAYAIAGIVVGLVLMVFIRWWAERVLMRVMSDRVPQGRLRRSALACAGVVAGTALLGLGAEAMVIGLDWHDAFSDTEKQLAHAFVAAVFFGSFIARLGRALLSAQHPSWRLPSIPNDIALALQPFPWFLGATVVLSILLRRINSVAGASLAATVAASLITALLYGGIVLWALIRIARVGRHRIPEAETKADAEPRSLWSGLVLLAFWVGSVTVLLAAACGFVAFAQFVAALMVRVLFIGGASYLLIHLVEDIASTLVAARAEWMRDSLGVSSRALEQAAVVLSGAFRLVAFLFALSLIFSGFGGGRAELSQLSAQIGSSALKFGQIEITPDAVLGAMAVLLFGLLAIRALKRWLHERYLPTTSLDPAMRGSVTTLLGYVCGIIVFAFALSALGLSVERIAWVASALSVGIGFGLQAVVQNFVSGLILLVERPVKVGDWVALGDIEGDIRRISVRATEIQMGDRSTLIVPNSELITKTVRNVTLANAQGRVQIRLPMPLDTDADAVIATMREAFEANERILETPALSITADGIQNGALIFVGVAFIDNPRQAGAIRSAVLLDLLARLRSSGIAMVKPQEVSYRRLDLGPPLPDVPTES